MSDLASSYSSQYKKRIINHSIKHGWLNFFCESLGENGTHLKSSHYMNPLLVKDLAILSGIKIS